MKIYTTCTNLETCSNVEITTIEYDEDYDPIVICSVCGDYAVNTTEPILEMAISNDIFYFKNLIILDEIAKDINLYEKEKKGKNNATNQKKPTTDYKQ